MQTTAVQYVLFLFFYEFYKYNKDKCYKKFNIDKQNLNRMLIYLQKQKVFRKDNKVSDAVIEK